MNNPYDIFKEVSDHPILFECYVSLIEKIGDVIWDGYGGVGGGYDNERAEMIKHYWKIMEPSLVENFKSELESLIELRKEFKESRIGS